MLQVRHESILMLYRTLLLPWLPASAYAAAFLAAFASATAFWVPIAAHLELRRNWTSACLVSLEWPYCMKLKGAR